MKKKGNGWFWLAAIGIIVVAGACISGTQKSGLTIENFEILPDEIHPGESINIELDVVNHEGQVLDPDTNKSGVFVCRIEWDNADEKWHCVEDDKYWKNLPNLKWIDKEIGSEGSLDPPISFTATSKDTIPSGGAEYTFQAYIVNETGRPIANSPKIIVKVT